MANFTLDTPPAQDARILDAFGKRLNLFDGQDPPQPRAATGAEVKQQIIQFLKNAVQEQEQNAALKIARDSVTEIDVT